MNIEYMKEAIRLAKKSKNDVPVGAVIVKDGIIIAKAVNERELRNCVVSHAEIVAIQKANKVLNNWRLEGCEIYVTLEPCPMCASAIVQARIKNVYFGAYDMINGAFGSVIDMKEIMNSKINIIGGIMEIECKNLISEYFQNLRNY